MYFYKFSDTKIKKYEEELTYLFKKHFNAHCYEEHKSVDITSGIDKSTYFIGSTISVLKPYLFNNIIPEGGFYLVQKCLRTQNTKILCVDDSTMNWSSYFTAIGTLSHISHLQETSRTIWFFFNEVLNIPREDIKINISSEDNDLLEVWSNIDNGPILDIDTKDINYYRHNYGMPGVWGRNLNFAIRCDNDNFRDIGNLIIIENENAKLGVELAFGVSTTLSSMYNLPNSIAASSISEVIPFKEGFVTKFSDALSASIILLKGGIKPTASNTKGRVLRTYIRSLSYLRKKIGINLDEIRKFASLYESKELATGSDIGIYLEKYLLEYEKN